MSKKLNPEITSEKEYASRREFIKTLGVVGISAAVLAACQDKPFVPGADLPADAGTTADPGSGPTTSSLTDELGDDLTPYEDVISYNNFYEFTTDKEGVAKLAANFNSHIESPHPAESQ